MAVQVWGLRERQSLESQVILALRTQHMAGETVKMSFGLSPLWLTWFYMGVDSFGACLVQASGLHTIQT